MADEIAPVEPPTPQPPGSPSGDGPTPQTDWRQMLAREVGRAKADLQGQLEEAEKRYSRLSTKYEREVGEWQAKYKDLQGQHEAALEDFAWVGATAPYGLDEETLDLARHRYSRHTPEPLEDGTLPPKPSVAEWFAREVEARPPYLAPFLPQEEKPQAPQGTDRPWLRALPQIHRSVAPPQPPMPSSAPDWKHMSKEQILEELRRQGK